jgi:hypothetical protein
LYGLTECKINEMKWKYKLIRDIYGMNIVEPAFNIPSTPYDPESDAGGSLSSWQGHPSR